MARVDAAGNYTYSKCLDDGSSESGTTSLLIPFNRAPCDLDRTHAGVFSYDYELPFGKGRRFLSGVPGWADQAIGGWVMAGVVTLQSGLPFTPRVGDLANTGVSGQRPDVIAPPIMPETVGCWFYTSSNSACRALLPDATNWFALPPKYLRYGTGGRNILRADGLKTWDSVAQELPNVRNEVFPVSGGILQCYESSYFCRAVNQG